MNAVDIQNVHNVCRLCLSMEEPKASIFADQTSSVSLVMKIQSCLSIEILTSDRVSTMICVECMRRVNKWYVYKEYCLRSQQKLQHCLGDQLENLGNIKVEPMDVYEPPSPLETVPLTTDDELESLPGRRIEAIPMISPAINHNMTMITAIKREVIDENGTLDEMNSFTSPELLINPMALTGHKEDRLMEADSTQKFINVKKTIKNSKKKLRRGPHTHFRGVRQFKQRCPHCQIYLHSKYSYGNHMKRFHSGKIYDKTHKRASNAEEDMTKVHSDENTEEIEDVEDELANLEKDSPLTPVQQNIISQLKTFSCYSCRQSFGDRRSTLNHIRQHMPDLRPYTCIACLTEFADRSIYKLHCGASFQCAMKIALVIPEHGTEKYFTCNMCLRSLSNRRELLSHLSRHSDKQYEQLLAHPFNAPPKLKPMTAFTLSPKKSLKPKPKMAEMANHTSVFHKKGIPNPYKSGDPAYNHKCIYCGMIYRYKQNMFKHVTLCKHLPPEVRVCYQCVVCGLTFLAFSKFQNHFTSEHKKRDIECSHCRTKFKQPSDFLHHYRDECTVRLARVRQNLEVRDEQGDWEIETTDSSRPIETGKFGCALCPETVFDTRVKLVDHMKIHSNPSVFSCTICNCTFGNASTLESHMAEHEVGIPPPALEDNMCVPLLEDERTYDTNASRFSVQSDLATNNTECNECGKVFANYPNLRRHIRSVHDAVGRFNCFTCALTFVTEEQWQDHVDKEHESTSTMHACPLCPEVFETELSLNNHRHDVHGLNGEAHLACYICGKIFINETSLKIHRGHHFRVNSRLSIGNLQKPSVETDGANDDGEIIVETRKSPTARKSFPNGSPQARLMNFLQCQVCDERFHDVVDLRKHLWDVHCARTKPERSYASHKFQCELCTNVLPDEEALASHMKWHESNPILSHVEKTDNVDEQTQCDLCGKYYSSLASMRKHKRRHKLGTLGKFHGQTRKKNTGHVCTICRKVFAGKTTLAKHKEVAHTVRTSTSIEDRDIIRPVRPRLDFDAIVKNHGVLAKNDEKKSVNCNLCRRVVPNMRALYKHRQRVHKIVIEDDATALRDDYYDSANNGDRVVCTICDKNFSSIGNMKKHFKRVHSNTRVSSQFKCSIEGCGLQFKNRLAKDNHENTHSNLMYTCALCPRFMLSRASMDDHMLSAHRTNYARENNAILCKKIDLDSYVVKGANGRQCPLCKINYPNNKALKVHYLKVHEGGA